MNSILWVLNIKKPGPFRQVPRWLEGFGSFQYQWPCADDVVRHPEYRFVAALAMRLKPQRDVDDADAARGHLLQFRGAHHAHASLCAWNHHAPWMVSESFKPPKGEVPGQSYSW